MDTIPSVNITPASVRVSTKTPSIVFSSGNITDIAGVHTENPVPSSSSNINHTAGISTTASSVSSPSSSIGHTTGIVYSASFVLSPSSSIAVTSVVNLSIAANTTQVSVTVLPTELSSVRDTGMTLRLTPSRAATSFV